MRPTFRLYLITDRHECPRPLPEVVAEACKAGVRAVQLREKDLSSLDLFKLGRQLKRICDNEGAQLIVNDRVDIALALGTAGVHLTTRSLPIQVARRLIPKASLVGVSTHGLAEAISADEAGADFIVLSPIFETGSASFQGKTLGIEGLRRVCEKVALPTYALGGITPGRAKECIDAGAFGVAVRSIIMRARDIHPIVSAFREAILHI